MVEENINYLLVEANRIKVGGYTDISVSFLDRLIDYIYKDNLSSALRLKKKFKGMSTDDKIYVEEFTKNIIHDSKYLATCSNIVVRNIYIQSKVKDVYRELGFILFLTGLVNSYDYIRYNTDINYVIGKFLVRDVGFNFNKPSNAIKRLSITKKSYVKLMALYLKNTTDGVNYGFSVYDFIYHMLNNSKDKHGICDYQGVLKVIHSIGITDFNSFSLNKNILDKYSNEVGIMLPLLVRNVDMQNKKGIVKYILGKSDINLVKTILREPDFILCCEGECIQYNK